METEGRRSRKKQVGEGEAEGSRKTKEWGERGE